MAKLPNVRNGEGLQRMDDFIAWDPFSQITNARHTMNSLLDSVLRPGGGSLTSDWGSPQLDLYEKDGKYVVEFAVPGLKKDDINIEVDDNRLTLSAKRQEEKTEENTRYHYRELRRGGFSRSISFPQEIDGDNVSAEYENGILRVTLPPTKRAQAKKVQIKG
ncbi:MAG: Hsp20/alpha crystallin family protein [Candidatus Eremiobacteraeota bacterium]|nr:Hsp20/alpha crystallin family protein [Candidatus Eremiobacteraeota bacterium]